MKKTELNQLILEVLKEDNWTSKPADPKKKGALKKQLGVAKDKPIPDSRVDSELSGIHSKVDKGQKLSKDELTKQRRLQATKNARTANEIVEDEISGGKGDTAVPDNFDPSEIEMGIKTEMEHTDDEQKAKEIAMDHLTEDPKYYSKLKDAGLADELEESVRKEVRTIIKEYYRDEQATKFADAVIDLLNVAKAALSSDMEKAAEKYFTKYYRSAPKQIELMQTVSSLLNRIKSTK